MHDRDEQPDLLQRQAAEWVVRMQRPDAGHREQERLARWLALSPRHAEAYRRAEYAWQLSGALRDDPLLNPPVPRVNRFRRQRSLWLAACLLIGLMVGWEARHHVLVPLQSDYRTAAGEVRTIPLPDGSEVILGGHSAIKLDYTDHERRVLLLRGEAVFSPAPVRGAEQRAFVVEAAGTRNRALGTRYLVRRLDDDTGWTGVLEHRIEISREPRRSLTLSAGESARFGPAGVERSTLDPVQEAGWSRGVLIFRQQPLAEVTSRLNQYGAPRVLFLRQAVAEVPVSAVFRLDNIDQALPTLGEQLALRTLSLPGTVIIY